jgi:hypothetical protein
MIFGFALISSFKKLFPQINSRSIAIEMHFFVNLYPPPVLLSETNQPGGSSGLMD